MFGVDSFFIKIFLKFLLKDKSVDKEFINDLHSQLKVPFGNCKFLTTSFLTNIFHLYTLLTSESPSK